MDQEQLAYLGRSLNQRVSEATAKIDQTIEGVMRRNAAAGRLASGNTLHSFGEEAERVFLENVRGAAQFAFNLTKSNDAQISEQFAFFAGRVMSVVIDKVHSGSLRLGLREHDVAPHVTNIGVMLENRKRQLIDDFNFGMLGNIRMNDDPVVNIINTQTNSPGAVQQIGVGTFSQMALAQQHGPLIAAIDAAIASAEFAKLKEHDKQGFRDVADIVREEAQKADPDVSKLRRWADRLVNLGSELGMHAAVNAIVQILAKIFGG